MQCLVLTGMGHYLSYENLPTNYSVSSDYVYCLQTNVLIITQNMLSLPSEYDHMVLYSRKKKEIHK